MGSDVTPRSLPAHCARTPTASILPLIIVANPFGTTFPTWFLRELWNLSNLSICQKMRNRALFCAISAESLISKFPTRFTSLRKASRETDAWHCRKLLTRNRPHLDMIAHSETFYRPSEWAIFLYHISKGGLAMYGFNNQYQLCSKLHKYTHQTLDTVMLKFALTYTPR